MITLITMMRSTWVIKSNAGTIEPCYVFAGLRVLFPRFYIMHEHSLEALASHLHALTSGNGLRDMMMQFWIEGRAWALV